MNPYPHTIVDNKGISINKANENCQIIKECWPRWHTLHRINDRFLIMYELVNSQGKMSGLYFFFTENSSNALDEYQLVLNELMHRSRAIKDRFDAKEQSFEIDDYTTVDISRSEPDEMARMHNSVDIHIYSHRLCFQLLMISSKKLNKLATFIQDYAKRIEADADARSSANVVWDSDNSQQQQETSPLGDDLPGN